MNKFQHFVAKHRTLMKILLTVLWIFVFVVAVAILDMNKWVAIICYALIVFIYYIWVDSAAGAVMQKTLKDLDDKCDPYPLLSETEKLLTYKNSENIQHIVLMNRAVALADTGEYQAAYDMQKTVNIDKNPALLNKCAYYNNLFAFCMNLDKYDEAGVWYEKFMQIYDSLKEKKAKELMKGTALSARALEAYRTGDYYKAIELINSASPRNMRVRVSHAMNYAKVCIALGEKERAEESLNFVIANGNKLHCVKEAEALKQKLAENEV